MVRVLLLRRRNRHNLVNDSNQPLRTHLAEIVADSLSLPIPASTRRDVTGPVSLPNKATAVIGMRRSGKTTFLHQLRTERLARGVSRERLPFWNFEDERLAQLQANQLHLLVDEYYRLHPEHRQQQTVTICLDEVQVVAGWERFVRRLLDTEKVELFLSGSSAALLSREVATSMRGRAWEVVIHPFSFPEALRHAGKELPDRADGQSSRQRSLLERQFADYLATGGFPEAQGLDAATRHRLLRDYVDVVMLRDVMERHEITSITALRWLVRHLLGNAGTLFSVQKFFASLKSQGLKIGKDTVHQLVAYLEDCFLVRTVWIESDSERRRMVNPRKVYPIDPGLIAVFDRSGKANVGHALETAVLLELERRGATVTYVRTASGFEVDFLARFPAGDVELIQVAAEASRGETAARELRALQEARSLFPAAAPRLVVMNSDGLPADVPVGIVAQAATEWFLAEPATS